MQPWLECSLHDAVQLIFLCLWEFHHIRTYFALCFYSESVNLIELRIVQEKSLDLALLSVLFFMCIIYPKWPPRCRKCFENLTHWNQWTIWKQTWLGCFFSWYSIVMHSRHIFFCISGQWWHRVTHSM